MKSDKNSKRVPKELSFHSIPHTPTTLKFKSTEHVRGAILKKIFHGLIGT